MVIRIKEGTKNIVILRYAALFYWAMWPLILLGLWMQFNPRFIAWPGRHIVTGCCFLTLILLSLPYRSTTKELIRIMKERPEMARGSKFSFSNPLRYEWDD